MKEILQATGATAHEAWLSDSLENNYRYQIDQSYKSSRKKQPKPKHYNALKSFLQYEWGAKITEGQEADDELGIRQSELQCRGPSRPDSTICSIDKDLLQVPGKHYNFVRREHYFVEPLSGTRSFYSQFLIGDRIDDIEGVRGFGKVYTGRLLDPCQTELEMFQRVREKYHNDERLLKNGRLLWVRRERNQMWNFPKDGQMTLNVFTENQTQNELEHPVGSFQDVPDPEGDEGNFTD